MPPVIIVALGAFGVAALAKLLSREARRVNAELDAARDAAEVVVAEPGRPTLRRDPATGDYRPHQG